MEVHPGVFVSNADTDEWEPDPEVSGELHTLCSGVGVEAGMTRYRDDPGPVAWTPPQRETIVILEGEVRIEFADGPTLELKAGDLASLPKGAEMTWHVIPPFKEFWVIA